MLWMISAVTTPLALAVYLFIVDWIDLFPWNNVRAVPFRHRFLNMVNYPLLFFIAWAFLVGTYILMVSACIIIIIFYVLFYIISWWVPYIFGISAKQQQAHEQKFAGTVTVLPGISNHPVPNVERMIAGVLIVLMLVSAIHAM